MSFARPKKWLRASAGTKTTTKCWSAKHPPFEWTAQIRGFRFWTVIIRTRCTAKSVARSRCGSTNRASFALAFVVPGCGGRDLQRDLGRLRNLQVRARGAPKRCTAYLPGYRLDADRNFPRSSTRRHRQRHPHRTTAASGRNHKQTNHKYHHQHEKNESNRNR